MAIASTRLADEMKRVARESGGGGSKELTRRELSALTGVSTSTIQKMFDGQPPGCEHVIRFAKSVREDVGAWLELCGYPDIAEDYRDRVYLQPTKGADDELERLLAGVPASRRIVAREAIRRTIKSVIMPLLEVTT